MKTEPKRKRRTITARKGRTKLHVGEAVIQVEEVRGNRTTFHIDAPEGMEIHWENEAGDIVIPEPAPHNA